MLKKFIVSLMTVLMCFSQFPQQIIAEDNEETEVVENTSQTEASQEEYVEVFEEEPPIEETAVEEVSQEEIKTEEVDIKEQVQIEEGLNYDIFSASFNKKIALIDSGVGKKDSYDSVHVLERLTVLENENTSGYDDNGHGTSMFEYILSENPNAEVISIKAIDNTGRGEVADLVEAISLAMQKGAEVISISLSAYNPNGDSELENIIAQAISQGIQIVVAAGNDANDASGYLPASIDSVFTIGTAKVNGTRSELSNYGSVVDYNVIADSTSEATARFAGILSTKNIEEIDNSLNTNNIYSPDFVPEGETATPIGQGKTPDLSGQLTTPANVDIVSLTNQLSYGAVLDSDIYVKTPTSSKADQRFTFRVNFALSGVGELHPGEIRLIIPKSILLDRNNNLSDYYEMSVPNENEWDINDDVDFVYYEEDDYIVVYNIREVSAGTNGYFEVSYLTNKQTFHYEDRKVSEPFNVIMSSAGKTQVGEPISVCFDTNAVLTSTNKEQPTTLFRNWQAEWGIAPENSQDYYYLLWRVSSNIEKSSTQPYTFSLEDTVLSEGEVVGYKMAYQSVFSDNNSSTFQNTTEKRYDYVLTKHLKSNYNESDEYWIFENRVVATLTPSDGLDDSTSKTSTRTFRYRVPHFTVPSGHFNQWKHADGYWRNRKNANGYGETKLPHLGNVAGEYSRYDLEELKDGTVQYLDNFDYAVYEAGYPYPWTFSDETGNGLKDYLNYGILPVKYELVDNNELYLDDFKLEPGDFQIDHITFGWSYNDSVFNEEEQRFDPAPVTYTEDDILTFYGNIGDDILVEIGSYNLKTKQKNFDSNYITNIEDINNSGFFRIYPVAGMIGYKVETTNSHYYTELDSVVNYRLNGTQRVLDYIQDLDDITLINKSHGYFYDSEDQLILSVNTQDEDYARIIERDSDIQKKIVSATNNTKKKYYDIGWRVEMNETYTIGDGQTFAMEQTSGVFYDLLPIGGNLDVDSVAIRSEAGFLPNNAYDVSTIPNFRQSGRTMLVVKIKQSGAYYTMYYDTIHPWDSIKDWGNEVYNPVAYETGNNSIANGFADNGGNLKDKLLFMNLDPDSDANKFIYADVLDDISVITSAFSGLTKKVKTETDKDYVYDTTVSNDSDYQYRIRFMNSYINKSKNLVFFDDLENFTTPDGKASDWKGQLQSINLDQFKEKGIEPKVYINYSNVDLSQYDSSVDLDSVLSQWIEVDNNTDLSQAKALAIDLRKTTTGDDFVLEEGDSVSAILYMKSPRGAEDPEGGYPETYNNIYIYDTVISEHNNEESFFIHQDYTTVKLVITQDLSIHKINAQDNLQNIPNIKFRLKGTSDYGTEVDEIRITDRNGYVSFQDIEKGDYILWEYESTPDWILEPSEYHVRITPQGTIELTGQNNPSFVNFLAEQDNYELTLQNDPRIHGDVKFIKQGETPTKVDYKEEFLIFKGRSDSETIPMPQGVPVVLSLARQAGISDYYPVVPEEFDFTLVNDEDTRNLSKFRYYVNGALVDIKNVLSPSSGRLNSSLDFNPSESQDFSTDFLNRLVGYSYPANYEYAPTAGSDKLSPNYAPDPNEPVVALWTFLPNLDIEIYYAPDGFANDPVPTANIVTEYDFSKKKTLFELTITQDMIDNMEHADEDLTPEEKIESYGTDDYFGLMRHDCDTNYFSHDLPFTRAFQSQVATQIHDFGEYPEIYLKYNDIVFPRIINAYDDTFIFASQEAWDELNNSQQTNERFGGVGFGFYGQPIEQSDGSVLYCGERYYDEDGSPYVNMTYFQLFNTGRQLQVGDKIELYTYETTKKNLSAVGIPNTVFKLSGTSDYGNDILEIRASNNFGYVNFKDIEKGTYTLEEVQPNEEYILNNTKWTVKIDEQGNYSILEPEDESLRDRLYEVVNSGNTYILLNEPRYWQIPLRKVDATNNTILLEGAEFALTGVSDLGTEYSLTSSTDENGKLVFDRVEKGTYILKEISPPQGVNEYGKIGGNRNYVLNPREYVIEIDHWGNVNSLPLKKNERNEIIFPNERAMDGRITVVKRWVDNSNNDERPNPEIHLSAPEPEWRRGITVTKVWEGDTPEDRPDNPVIHLVSVEKGTVAYDKIQQIRYSEQYDFCVANDSSVLIGDAETSIIENRLLSQHNGFLWDSTQTSPGFKFTPKQNIDTDLYLYTSTDYNFESNLFKEQYLDKIISYEYNGEIFTNDTTSKPTCIMTTESGVKFKYIGRVGLYPIVENVEGSTLDVEKFVKDNGGLFIMSTKNADPQIEMTTNANSWQKSGVLEEEIWSWDEYADGWFTEGFHDDHTNETYDWLDIDYQIPMEGYSDNLKNIPQGKYDASKDYAILIGMNKYVLDTVDRDRMIFKKDGSSNSSQRVELVFLGNVDSSSSSRFPRIAGIADYTTSISEGDIIKLYKQEESTNVWTYTFDILLEDENANKEFYVWEEDNVYDKYNTINDSTNPVKVENQKATITNKLGKGIKYAVSVYGIGQDVNKDGEKMGLTFGPALGEDYTLSFKSHNPYGYTINSNAHRCLHNDDWNTIIHWNNVDPYVYEQCISEKCTHSIELDNTPGNGIWGSSHRGQNSLYLKGDGVGALGSELDGNNAMYWQGTYNLKLSSTSTGSRDVADKYGWGGSRIRAMLNGYDDLTFIYPTQQDLEDFGAIEVISGPWCVAGKLNDPTSFTGSTTLLASFPESLQNAIGERTTIYEFKEDRGGEVKAGTSYDKLFLLSINEIDDSLTKDDNDLANPLEAPNGKYQRFIYNPVSFTQENFVITDTSHELQPYIFDWIAEHPEYSGSYPDRTWLRSIGWNQHSIFTNWPVVIFGYFQNPMLSTFEVGSQVGISPCFALDTEYDFTTLKYAVSVYGIGHDLDENNNVMGLTFGPALGGNYLVSHKEHTPAGETILGNPHRCLHNDTWEMIINWNNVDPYVYEQCISEECTHSILLDYETEGSIFDVDYLRERLSNPAVIWDSEFYGRSFNGDGAANFRGELYLPVETNETPYNNFSFENNAWNPNNSDKEESGYGGYGTTSGGWGASRIRAMLNGHDELTDIETNKYCVFSGAMPFHDSSSYYTNERNLLVSFPQNLQSAIGKRKTKYDSVYNDLSIENLKISYDKLWLLSPNEIFSSEQILSSRNLLEDSDHKLEGNQYQRFKNNSFGIDDRVPELNSWGIWFDLGKQIADGQDSWLRSTSPLNAFSVLTLGYGMLAEFSASFEDGVSPCFTLTRNASFTEIVLNYIDGNSNTLSSGKFEIRNHESESVLKEIDLSNPNNSISLPDGKYRVINTEASTGYSLIDEFTIIIKNGQLYKENLNGQLESLANNIIICTARIDPSINNSFINTLFNPIVVHAEDTEETILESGTFDGVDWKIVTLPSGENQLQLGKEGEVQEFLHAVNHNPGNIPWQSYKTSTKFSSYKLLGKIKIQDFTYLFGYTDITSADLSDFIIIEPLKGVYGLFEGCTKLTSINASALPYNLDTENSTGPNFYLFCGSAATTDFVWPYGDYVDSFIPYNSNYKFIRFKDRFGNLTYDTKEYSRDQFMALSIEQKAGTWIRIDTPKYYEALQQIDSDQAHYTSSNNAINIVKNGDVWTYTFGVFDDEIPYYIWEDKLDGYSSTVMKPVYDYFNEDKGKYYEITNVSTELASLEVSKTVNGQSTDKKFDFVITIEDWVGTFTRSDVIFKDGVGRIKLGHNETKLIEGLPSGKTFTITEVENPDYEAEQQQISGTLATGETSKASFVNTYVETEEETSGNPIFLTVSKKVIGTYDISRDYEITVYLENLVPDKSYNYTSSNVEKSGEFIANSSGQAVVTLNLADVESTTFIGLPQGASYQISEAPGSYISSFNITSENPNTFIRVPDKENSEENKQISTELETLSLGDDVKVAITNRLEILQPLSISKIVEGKASDKLVNYEFKIELFNLKPNSIYDSSIGRIVADEDGYSAKEFILKDGESVTFDGLPVGSKYQIIEKKNKLTSSYQITDKNNVGQIQTVSFENELPNTQISTELETVNEGEDIEVTFTNTRETSLVKLRKVVAGSNGNKEDTFTFTVTFNNQSNSYQLGHNQEVEISVPLNAVVTMSEENYTEEGYKTYINNSIFQRREITFTADDDKEIVFKNVRDMVIPTGIKLPFITIVIAELASIIFFLKRKRKRIS